MIRTDRPSIQFRWTSRTGKDNWCESRTFLVIPLHFTHPSGNHFSEPFRPGSSYNSMLLFENNIIMLAAVFFTLAGDAAWHPSCSVSHRYAILQGDPGLVSLGKGFSVLTSGGSTVIKSRPFCPFPRPFRRRKTGRLRTERSEGMSSENRLGDENQTVLGGRYGSITGA
jgi:hypothetical protein